MPSYIQIIAHYKSNHFDREAIGMIMFDEEKVIYRFKKIKNKMVREVVKYYDFSTHNLNQADYLHRYSNNLIRYTTADPVASEVSEEKFNQLFGVLIG